MKTNICDVLITDRDEAACPFGDVDDWFFENINNPHHIELSTPFQLERVYVAHQRGELVIDEIILGNASGVINEYGGITWEDKSLYYQESSNYVGFNLLIELSELG